MSLIRSDGAYWAACDASAADRLREFSEHLWPRATRIAAEERDYRLMVVSRLHYALEDDGVALIFIPWQFGVYQLDFSVFLEARNPTFAHFATDQFTQCPRPDVNLQLPTGELCIVELRWPFARPSPIVKLPPGVYRAACFDNYEQQWKHEFLEGDYPVGDGPDFKFYLERQFLSMPRQELR